jgi:hypothetical protein
MPFNKDDIVSGGVLHKNAYTKIIRYGGINTYLQVGVDIGSVVEIDTYKKYHKHFTN